MKAFILLNALSAAIALTLSVQVSWQAGLAAWGTGFVLILLINHLRHS